MDIIETKVYPYLYSISFENIDILKNHSLNHVQNWCYSQKIDCILTINRGLFKSKHDITLFILRWL